MSASRFRDLHRTGALLVLPNAWDAGSAVAIQHAGAPAVATTSAGVAWACGWPDGDKLPASEVLGAATRMARVLTVPLSADIEEGCSSDPDEVGRFVASLVDVGVAGINIEDAGRDPAELAAKIRAIRAALGGRDLYINARTDIYLRGLASGDGAVGEVVRRAGLFREAGADGLFAPGIANVGEIRRVAGSLGDMPLNVMLVPGLPSHAELYDAGARRLSAGIALALDAYAGAAKGAAAFMGNAEPEALSYPLLNRLLARPEG
ncbi:isocitrate lyase/PEP mutase family protein [Luteibacter aegosomatissinici]|uniref:isocitrate lyase/PEP mutase family protein n=1 Tax=Luteibacter aegosomatissinici TaxID=2911539 RepID=UPI001FF87A6B|nr:isocitrate lyase/phosphoenolpyruvate mutase family protein [Luteibacter aegosomatissinici]UPG94195.1 isocitrate lyase/phosphoenolpyruvate mutase family protein [Luteibacter aegosomatissinici]